MENLTGKEIRENPAKYFKQSPNINLAYNEQVDSIHNHVIKGILDDSDKFVVVGTPRFYNNVYYNESEIYIVNIKFLYYIRKLLCSNTYDVELKDGNIIIRKKASNNDN